MNPTSANFRSRLGDPGRCSRTCEWALASTELSAPRFFLPGGTAALQTRPQVTRQDGCPARLRDGQVSEGWALCPGGSGGNSPRCVGPGG